MSMLMRYLLALRHLLGLPGMTGLALLLAGLGVYLLGVLPVSHQVRMKEAEISQLRAHPLQPEIRPAPPRNDAQVLDEFMSQFPGTKALSRIVAELHQLAQAQGIVLAQGEYKLTGEEGARLLKYEIILPVKASYPQLRHFIDEAARKFPTLGLSDLSFKREAIGENAVQVKLTFVLYLARAE